MLIVNTKMNIYKYIYIYINIHSNIIYNKTENTKTNCKEKNDVDEYLLLGDIKTSRCFIKTCRFCGERIKTSQASPKQLVESAFNISKTETIQSNRSLHTRAISLLLCSDDPPDILTFLNKASINRRNGDKEMNEARKEVVVQLTSLFKADTKSCTI